MQVFRQSRALLSPYTLALHYTRAFATNATECVPEGHKSSDLSNVACNIGLNRRRDITLRQDLRVNVDGQEKSLEQVFKSCKSVVVGLPDAGSICKEKHAPTFMNQMDQFKAKGFSQILLASVCSPEQLATFAKAVGADGNTVKAMADPSGAFHRMLGMDLNPAGSEPPYCQRYAGLVEDGILVRLRVEASPADVKVSSGSSMMEEINNLSH